VLSPSKVRAALKMNAAGTGQYAISEGMVNAQGRKVGPSLAEVLEPVKDSVYAKGKAPGSFMLYAFARRALTLLDRGINPGVSRADAKYVVQQYETPAFKAASDGLTTWANGLIDYVVQSGGLSSEAAQAIRDANPVYLPLQRFFDESYMGPRGLGGGMGEVNKGSPVKRIKGSGRRVVDPVRALAVQAEAFIRVGNEMRVARALADLAEKVPGSAWFAEKVAPPQEISKVTVEDLAKQLEAAGADLNAADMQAVLSIVKQSAGYVGKDNIVTLWRKGQREFWSCIPTSTRC
jgi:hypothetical protein